MTRRSPLQVTLVARDGLLPASAAAALQALIQDHVVRIAAAIARPAAPGPRAERLLERAQRLLESRAGPRPVALASAFPAAPPSLSTACDLVVLWGVEDAPGLPPPRRGTLRLEVGGTAGTLGNFRALVHGRRQVAIVARLATREGDTVLAHALPALPDHPTLLSQEAAVQSRLGAVLAKALRRLFLDEPGDTAAASLPAPTPPVGLAEHARYLAKRSLQSLAGRWRQARKDLYWRDDENNWFLAWRTTPEHFTCNRERFDARGFQLLFPPPGRFYADPCVVHVAGRDHVFFEEWRQETNRGVISWMALGDDGALSEPVAVLEADHHLSYPFVFETGGEVYMIPETAAAGRVDLYCATDFPRGWEKVTTLLDGVQAADTTMHFHDGRWWMFATVGEPGTSKNDQLCLYHAESLSGPWQPHAANPVKIDAGSARPAGRLFHRGGRLMRPSQDCTTAYGAALTLAEVTCLTPERFEERVVERIGPGWLPQNVGFHTVAHGRRLEVIDGRIRSGASRFPEAAQLAARLATGQPSAVAA